MSRPSNNRRHGETKTRLHNIWCGMHKRCNNPASDRYKYYGARGIRVCKEWGRYETFRDWALANGYRDGLEIERKENDGNYEPSNCKWSTRIEQANNKRTSLIVVFRGVEMSFANACRAAGMTSDYRDIHRRMRKGASLDDAMAQSASRRRLKRCIN